MSRQAVEATGPSNDDQANALRKLLSYVRHVPDALSAADIVEAGDLAPEPDPESYSFWHLQSVTHDSEVPRRDAMESMISMLSNPAFNFIYIISGSGERVDLILGIIRNRAYTGSQRLTAKEMGQILQQGFEAYFLGSRLQCLTADDVSEKILQPACRMERAGLMLGVPNVNATRQQEIAQQRQVDVQGIDRLINALRGKTWQVVIVCEPVPQSESDRVIARVSDLYDAIQRISKVSLQQQEGTNSTRSDSVSDGVSQTEAHGTSHTAQESRNESTATGTSRGKSTGTSENENGSSGSRTRGTNTGMNEGSSTQHSTGKASSTSDGTTESTTKGTSRTETSGTAVGHSSGTTVSQELVNKRAVDTLKYLDEELLKRLRLGIAKGLFKTAVYALAPDALTFEQLSKSLVATFQGDAASIMPLTVIALTDQGRNDGRLGEPERRLLTGFQTYHGRGLDAPRSYLRGQPHYEQSRTTGLSTYMTSQEISILAGIPLNEVPGLPLKAGIEFGLNTPPSPSPESAIDLGYIMQRGQPLVKSRVALTRDVLAKHLFIAGVTGSGKTTTCHKLLIDSCLPFLVIEPAKTEYRVLLRRYPEKRIMLWTLGDEQVAPFRFNPFELLRGESITAHVDLLRASFTAAFSMEASMPQLLEEALYKAYESYGWDVDTGRNLTCADPWADPNGAYFPTLNDFLDQMTTVVKSKNFAPELRDNYIGSLVSRFSNLAIGGKGLMLNCRKSIDFDMLLDRNVIIEMEPLKSPEDKAFLIGLILGRMTETIKRRHRQMPSFRHLTLVEEAHRLLSRPNGHGSGAQRSAVEMFTDLLAEVRKYGEGLIIVDQIPNKLAPEVLKNTNTKLIHKLFARDDKEAIGDTMMMNDKQKQYLSALDPGQAIMFSEGWAKPIHIQVESKFDTATAEPTDEAVAEYVWPQLLASMEAYVAQPLAGRIRARNGAAAQKALYGRLVQLFALSRRLAAGLNRKAKANDPVLRQSLTLWCQEVADLSLVSGVPVEELVTACYQRHLAHRCRGAGEAAGREQLWNLYREVSACPEEARRQEILSDYLRDHAPA